MIKYGIKLKAAKPPRQGAFNLEIGILLGGLGWSIVALYNNLFLQSMQLCLYTSEEQ